MKNSDLVEKTIKIYEMHGEKDYTGKTGVVKYVDDIGQLHGTWGGCALVPEIDKFRVIDETIESKEKNSMFDYPWVTVCRDSFATQEDFETVIEAAGLENEDVNDDTKVKIYIAGAEW